MASRTLQDLTADERQEAAAIYEDVRQYSCSRLRGSVGQEGDRRRRIALRLLDEASADLDRRLPEIPCRRGCASCCTLPVHVDATEVFGILDYMQKTLSTTERERIFDNIRATATALRAIPESARPSTRRACPFLTGNTCAIYSARPMMCRAHHSTDRSACDAQSREGVPAQLIRHVVLFGIVESYLTVQSQAGQASEHWELVGALDEAIRDPGARMRLSCGESPFTFMLPVPLSAPTSESGRSPPSLPGTVDGRSS